MEKSEAQNKAMHAHIESVGKMRRPLASDVLRARKYKKLLKQNQSETPKMNRGI